MRFTIPLFILMSTLTVAGCDLATDDSQSVRQRLGDELDEAQITLSEAIEIAQKEAPGAIVLEAKLDVHTNVTTYDIELLDGGAEREIDVSPSDGSIVRDRSRALDADDLAEAEAAAGLVSTSIGWVEILAKAEAEVGGVAFEAEADGDDGVLEVQLFVDGVIWETEHAPDGSLTKAEKSDDQLDATEQEDEVEDDDGVEVEDEDDDETEDENEDEEEDENEVEDDDEAEDETEDDA